jgi:hypothetical protein
MDEETFFEQAKTEIKTDVLGGAVNFHLIVNGSDKDQTTETGGSLRGSIDYKNPGTESVEGVKFALELKSEKSAPIDWDKVELSDGKKDGSIVRWDKTTNKELAKIEPGKEGVIDFTLPIVGSLSSNQADKFTITLSTNVEKVGKVASTHTIDATPIVVSVNTNVKLTSEAEFLSGELPPSVQKTTSYKVVWSLSNSLHELGNVEVSTILPADVVWKENSVKDIGTLSYNSTTRQVRWQIAKLPTDVKNATAWFEISITPKSQDVGKFFKLTNQTTLEAIDSFTKAEVNSSLPVLNTQTIVN